MFRQILLFIFVGFLGCIATKSNAREPIADFSPDKMKWQLGKFAKLSEVDGKKLLTVDVPKDSAKGQSVAVHSFDITKYRGKKLSFTIQAKAEQVSVPPEQWNGIKFMLNFKQADGNQRWLNPSNLNGTFAWKEIQISSPVEKTATDGRLMLGLQDSYGKITFDLSSLKVYDDAVAMVNQDFKISYPANANPVSRGVMSPNSFAEDDFKTLKEWNANLMRVQITRNWGKTNTEMDIDEYDKWLNGKLDDLEKALPWAEKYGVKLIIDLHSPPGGRDESRNMRMFYEEKYAAHFINCWKRIATRFKGNKNIVGYDIINEPVQNRPALYDYWTLQRMAAEAVRAIDPDTPIIIESNEWDSPMAFSYLSPLKMDNVIYQVHMYLPGQFTHQGVGNSFGELGSDKMLRYPGKIGDVEWNRAMIKQSMQPVRDFQLKHNARIFVGEFSAITWAPGAEKYIEDCISVFEEYKWDWTYHAFREWQGWSVEHTGTPDNKFQKSDDNPRKQVLLKYLKNNNK
jgi:aryl-phospho-beta-D-glucosidase BglC (GH1 family)